MILSIFMNESRRVLFGIPFFYQNGRHIFTSEHSPKFQLHTTRQTSPLCSFAAWNVKQCSIMLKRHFDLKVLAIFLQIRHLRLALDNLYTFLSFAMMQTVKLCRHCYVMNTATMHHIHLIHLSYYNDSVFLIQNPFRKGEICSKEPFNTLSFITAKFWNMLAMILR
jgi:hypothetical protein